MAPRPVASPDKVRAQEVTKCQEENIAFPGWENINNSGVNGTFTRDGWTICYTVGWKITRPDGFEYAYRPERMETAVRFVEKRMKAQQK